MSNAPRFLVAEIDDGSLKIIIPSKKNIFELIWFGICSLWGIFITGNALYFWGTMIFIAIVAMTQGMNVFDLWLLWLSIGMILPFLLIFIGFTSLVMFDFAWKVAGKEIVDVGTNEFTFMRQIWRWRKANDFETSHITNLRVEKQKTSWFPLFKAFLQLAGQNNHLALDCEGKTFRFGRELNQIEAEQILALIQSRHSSSTQST